MVGGLVEGEHVGAAEEGAREGDAAALAEGEGGDRLVGGRQLEGVGDGGDLVIGDAGAGDG
ncbi:MAG: hypothetical protein E6J90_50865 [Deltaproteobacteria bacterium]|nr:MAG: hypothetical protein E6J90_50865 [Deltaproteobacteria bacterium]